MNLAQLINKAMSNPQFGLALETGSVNLKGAGLSAHEISAAIEAVRYNRIDRGDNPNHATKFLIEPNSIGWRRVV